MRKSVVEYVSEYAVIKPDSAAVIVNNEITTYHKLYELACGYCNYLKKHGVSKGDIVVAKASQNLDYVVLYLAVHLAGGVIASVERNTTNEGFMKIVQKLNAKVIIADGITDDLSEKILLPRNNILLYAADHFNPGMVFSFPCEDDSADILFTTGTTGDSKGVELSHKALTATAENLIFGCCYKPDTVMILPGPLNHANAIRKLFTTLINGSTIIILNGMMNLKRFFDALSYPTGHIACCLPPSAIRTIFQVTGNKLGEFADRIDFIESATAPLPEPDKQKLAALLPNTRLYNNYGSSESASVCMYNYNENPGLIGCIGRAMPNSRVFIVDDNKQEISSSINRMGLLACDGDVNMKGYVNDPIATASVLIDGIVYTNDIGYIDENGFIYIAGRKGDVINVGGLKVAPTEVESTALEYDIVEDCICLGIDDAITGKALKLLVVITEGATLDVQHLRSFMISKLENYKVPTQYEVVDKIARTYNGKLDRKAYQ